MSRIDDLEALSRMQAGELSAAEEAALRARLAPGDLAALERLDAATAALGTELPQRDVDRLVRGALPTRRSRAGAVAIGAAAAVACLVMAVALWPRTPPVPVLELPHASVLLASGAEIVSGDPPVLMRGNALFTGRGAVDAAGIRVSVDGRALVSREPPGVLDRVPLAGGDMNWKKLTASVAAVGTLAVGVAVIEGRATVTPPDGPSRELKAGERFTSTGGAAPGAQAPAGSAGSASPEAEGADLTRLREEKEQLLRERARLKAELAAAQHTAAGALKTSPMNASHYRFSQAELVEMAENGMTLLRLPHLGVGRLPYDDSVRTDLGLTPAEEAGIGRIYGESFERMRSGLADVYQSLGGDPKAAAGSTPSTLWHDVLELCSSEDRADANREAARERAGLSPVTPGGTPALRVDRLLQGEDDRVVSELDALLGPDRAQQLLDHPGTQHSDFVSVHGPKKPQ